MPEAGRAGQVPMCASCGRAAQAESLQVRRLLLLEGVAAIETPAAVRLPALPVPDGGRLRVRVVADSVHHIVKLEDGGAPRDPANLLSVCRSHHSVIHAQRRGGRSRDVAQRESDWRLWALFDRAACVPATRSKHLGVVGSNLGLSSAAPIGSQPVAGEPGEGPTVRQPRSGRWPDAVLLRHRLLRQRGGLREWRYPGVAVSCPRRRCHP